jgi:hypothetical protein
MPVELNCAESITVMGIDTASRELLRKVIQDEIHAAVRVEVPAAPAHGASVSGIFASACLPIAVQDWRLGGRLALRRRELDRRLF